MANNNEISAGDHSNNVQGSKVTVNQYGLSYSEVKDAAMDVFKSNFYDLGEKVEDLINERAEEIINKYLEQLNKTSPNALNKTEDPDLRYSIYEAQKSHARRGDQEIADLLVKVLIDRTTEEGKDFIKLVLNETLTIIPKLTMKQIDTLSFIFAVRYIGFSNKISLSEFAQFIHPFSYNISTEEAFYQHLQYSGCLSISIGSVSFEDALKEKILDIEPAQEDHEIRKIMVENRGVFNALEGWNNTRLQNSSLTSVGMAIAISNIKSKLGVELDLKTWIKE